MARLVLLDLLAHLDHLVIEEYLDFLVQQDLLVEGDLLDHRVKGELLVHLARRGLQAHLGHRALLVQLEQEVKGEKRDLLVKMVLLVWEGLVIRVPLDLLGLLELLVLLDYQVHLAKVGHQETLEKEVKEVPMALQD